MLSCFLISTHSLSIFSTLPCAAVTSLGSVRCLLANLAGRSKASALHCPCAREKRMCGHVRSVLTRSLSHYHKSKQWAPYLELTLKEIKLCLKIYNKPVKNYSLVLTGSVLSPFFSLTLSHLICSMHVPDTAVEKCQPRTGERYHGTHRIHTRLCHSCHILQSMGRQNRFLLTYLQMQKRNYLFSGSTQTSEKISLKTKQLVPYEAPKLFTRTSLKHQLMGLSTGIPGCESSRRAAYAFPK